MEKMTAKLMACLLASNSACLKERMTARMKDSWLETNLVQKRDDEMALCSACQKEKTTATLMDWLSAVCSAWQKD